MYRVRVKVSLIRHISGDIYERQIVDPRILRVREILKSGQFFKLTVGERISEVLS